jgi:hypothetical protein
MVERSGRRRGMYGITKTRMLLTTTIFAAGAALFAGGANARVLMDEGDGASGAQASIVTSVVDSRFSITVSRAGSTRYGYVVGGELIVLRQSSAQLPSGFHGVADVGVNDDRFTVGVGFP